MKRFITGVWFILLSFLLFTEIFAGTTGKLAGMVRDKKTGEPLVGANVILVGTTWGAATDVDGYYVLLNVPAGTYTVEFNYLGYKTVRVENVRIVPDITKQLNVDMEPTVLQGEVIEVVAQKPFFEKTATNTIKVMEADEIQKVPLKGISQMVGLNAGVVMTEGSGGETGNAALFVRGGRANETMIIVDGIPYNNSLFGGNSGTIPDNAVEQVSSQLGGFSAKYGNAQSGIINIVTKTGSLQKYEGSFEATSSNLTDPYDYNSVNLTLGGPLRFISKRLSFFTSYEYINTGDDIPTAVPVEIPTVGMKEDKKPYSGSTLNRFTTKLALDYEKIKMSLTMTGSYRERRGYIHSYAKNNAEHNPITHQYITGLSYKLSHFITDKFFYDFTAYYRVNENETGDGVWFDKLFAYGDTLENKKIGVNLPAQGFRIRQDSIGVFFDHGRVSNFYRYYNIQTLGFDLNFTYQLKKHLIEFGGTFQREQVRFFSLGPVALATRWRDPSFTSEEKWSVANPQFYGYTVDGKKNDKDQFKTIEGTLWEFAGPKKPVVGGLYFNDKIEFQNFVLNAGLRLDYFDPATKRIRDLHNIFAYGANPNGLDPEDFEDANVEMYISPRLGFAFPITDKTVFHAQYGIFRQAPRYIDLYYNWRRIQFLESDQNFTANMGHLHMESTTHYEFGFNQQIGNVASIDITAFYKNVRGLTNIVREKTLRGQDTIVYMTPTNTDFGTVKGMSMGLDVRKIGPVSARVDYTLSVAEGTGSSQSSSFVAAFRNPDGQIPKAIAPLDFDQRHTLVTSISLNYGKDEGPMMFGSRWLQRTSTNFLISYNSGRPYTPLDYVNLLTGETNQGNVTYYVNSAYGPSNFRIDMKFQKEFDITKGVAGVVYLWVQNLLDADNAVSVYRSTGAPDNTAYLDTPEGQALAKDRGEDFVKDYKALEKNPLNYGIPRMIRLGFRVKF